MASSSAITKTEAMQRKREREDASSKDERITLEAEIHHLRLTSIVMDRCKEQSIPCARHDAEDALYRSDGLVDDAVGYLKRLKERSQRRMHRMANMTAVRKKPRKQLASRAARESGSMGMPRETGAT